MLFGKLTERAQKVLAYAQEEAITLKNSNIGTEHLLLGLVKEQEGIAKSKFIMDQRKNSKNDGKKSPEIKLSKK